MITPVVPQTFTRSYTITSVYLKVTELIPNNSVTFAVGYIDQNGEYISSPDLIYTIVVEGEEYANWTNNDGYILNLIFSKIGFTPQLPS